MSSMAKLLHTKIPLILAFLLSLANTARSQSEWVSFLYDFSTGGQPSNLIYQGDARFNQPDAFLSLTRTDPDGAAAPYSAGRVLYSPPVQFKAAGDAQADFTTVVKFLITPNAGDTFAAEGLTFFIAPVSSLFSFNSTGGSLAIFNKDGNAPGFFVVEFDINPNEGWDPQFRHIGIDIGRRESSNVTEVEDVIVGEEVTAFIRYVAQTKEIMVRAVVGSRTFEVTYVYDLATLLNEQVQVGLSASTGFIAAHHRIRSWYFDSVITSGDALIKQVV